MTSAEVAQSLKTNFAGERLAETSLAFISADERPQFPAALLLLSTVCSTLANFWDGPVLDTHATELREAFFNLIQDLANAISLGDRSRVSELSDSLATTLLNKAR